MNYFFIFWVVSKWADIGAEAEVDCEDSRIAEPDVLEFLLPWAIASLKAESLSGLLKTMKPCKEFFDKLLSWNGAKQRREKALSLSK